MIFNFLTKIFNSKNKRDIKKLTQIVNKINSIELEYQNLTNKQLKNKTVEFKNRILNGESIDQLMSEAYAVIKNTCRRLLNTKIIVCDQPLIWNMIPFDVQIMGGIVLKNKNVAEIATGEGKTLVATFPLYLHSLTGKNCQLVTVSDYHAKRDSEWMGVIYKFLDITVGCIQNEMTLEERKQQYNMDITYGTSSEFGFDYLRDMGMATHKDFIVQRDYYFVIIDEVDSILIDEARTPLIISGTTSNTIPQQQYKQYKHIVENIYKKQKKLCTCIIEEIKTFLNNKENINISEIILIKLLQIKIGMPKHKQLLKLIENPYIQKKLLKFEIKLKNKIYKENFNELQSELYFTIDEKHNEVDLTEKGRTTISPNNPNAFLIPDIFKILDKIDNNEQLTKEEKTKKKENIQEQISKNREKIHNITQLIKSFCLFEKNIDYIIQNNKIIIVDKNTGRLMPGRKFSDGIHQALEAKENVTIGEETQTLATITIQNYFKTYNILSGMTGTAESEANEFYQIYNMNVITIPTNKPCIRKDYNDSVYKTKREKYNAIINEIREYNIRKQPVLIGTTSIETSEILSKMLKINKIKHNVLNAKYHQYEANIIAQAGQFKAVTVATNMAGRGTDIKLEEGVEILGGLHIIGTERHDSRRIDRQLRGRCSRQGDAGSSKFYVSLEDNLMRLFGSDKIVTIMNTLGIKENEVIEHKILNKSIEMAQKRIEVQHFSARKITLDFDNIINKHRNIIYKFRRNILLTKNIQNIIFEILFESIINKITTLEKNSTINQFIDKLSKWINNTFLLDLDIKKLTENNNINVQIIAKHIFKKITHIYKIKTLIQEDENITQQIERYALINIIDKLWHEHLYLMDELKTSTTFRSYGQRDPLIEYKHESYNIFKNLINKLNTEITNNIFKIQNKTIETLKRKINITKNNNQTNNFHNQLQSTTILTQRHIDKKIGRNEICPCGSKKKYKKCCGK